MPGDLLNRPRLQEAHASQELFVSAGGVAVLLSTGHNWDSKPVATSIAVGDLLLLAVTALLA